MTLKIPPRAYAQYRNKPKFMAWLDIAHRMGGDIESAAQAVRMSYDIDTAVGEQLDVIGRIVVVDRGFISDIQLNQVIFSDDNSSAPQFGDEDAVFSSSSVATDSVMSDGLYRLAIKAKIAKNNGDATIQSILRQVYALSDDITYLSVIDGQDMSFSIEFQGNVDNLTRWALFNYNLIQKPAGVQFLGFVELGSFHVFTGYDDTQFGDEKVLFSGVAGGPPAAILYNSYAPGYFSEIYTIEYL